MSDSGFVDEAPRGPDRPSRTRPVDRAPAVAADLPTAAPETAPPDTETGTGTRRRRRRPTPIGIAFVVLVVGLLAFGGVAWASRLHADDVAAYESLASEIDVMDRSLPPLGHSEIPPCRDADGGRVTRTYPPSTGPQAAELVGYLVQGGWRQGAAVLPAVAHLTREANGRELTIDVVAAGLNGLVASMTAQSPGSTLGCLRR